MRIEVVAIGNKIPDWVQQGFADYQRRMPHYLDLQLNHLSSIKSSKHLTTEQRINQQGLKMLKLINPQDYMVALDVKGKVLNSPQLAKQLDNWQQLGATIKIVMGGADGLSIQCKQRANQLLSLSALTLPHQLVKLVIAEQLYRAHCINQGHPYHRQ